MKMFSKYYTAIVVSEDGGRPVFRKYRHIARQEAKVNRFIAFASRFPGVKHINFYDPGLPKGSNFCFQYRFPV